MAAPIDPEVQRSLDRLSRTMRSQRQGIAKSLGNLQEELTALVELSPNKKSDDLMAMRNSLNSAKREESAEMSFTQAQKFKIELQHANDEVSRRSAQARSLELQLKAKRGGEAELAAVEDELDRRTRAHESALEAHRKAEQELASRLAAAEATAQRLERQQQPASDDEMVVRLRGELNAANESLEAERASVSELASRLAELERKEGERKQMLKEYASMEEEVGELRADKRSLLQEQSSLEDQLAKEVGRSSELRSKLAAERAERKRLEEEAIRRRADQMIESATPAPPPSKARQHQQHPPPQPQEPVVSPAAARLGLLQPSRSASAGLLVAPPQPLPVPDGREPRQLGNMRPPEDDDDENDELSDDEDARAAARGRAQRLEEQEMAEAEEAFQASAGMRGGGSSTPQQQTPQQTPRTASRTPPQLPSAAACSSGRAAELQLVGSLAPGSTIRLMVGGAGGRGVGPGAHVEWWRVHGGVHGGNGQRVHGETAESYACSSEDVGCVLRAVCDGQEAYASGVVAPHRPMLALLQHKLEQEGKHSFKVRESGGAGRTLSLNLLHKKIEVVDEPAEEGGGASGVGGGGSRFMAKRGAKGGEGGKPRVLQSEAWSSGVVMRFVPGSDEEIHLQLASRNKPRKRPALLALNVSSRQQRDLVLLAVASFLQPDWLVKAQAGHPADLSFLTQPYDESIAPEPEAAPASGTASSTSLSAAAVRRMEDSGRDDETVSNAGSHAGSEGSTSSRLSRGAKRASAVMRAFSFGMRRKGKEA